VQIKRCLNCVLPTSLPSVKLDKNGIDRSMLQENETQFFINNQNGTCSYWTKPKIFDPIVGTITFRSKDYYFTLSF